MAEDDVIDGIRERLAELYPELDTSGLGVTGRILRLAAWLGAQRSEHLASLGLVPGEFDVLATIRRTSGEDGVNPGQLLASVMVTSGGLTKRLDRLEGAGLLERQPDPHDRRGTLVRLTPAGEALIDQAIPSLLVREHAVLASALTARQIEQTAGLLRRLGSLMASDASGGAE